MSRIDRLKQMLAAEPNDPFVLYGLAQEHARAGDHAAAIGFFDRCLAADPHHHYAYYHKGRVLEGLGRTAEAAAVVREGLAIARKDGEEKAAGELAAFLGELT